jgi:heme/copper-type cytochrome/quinol oxidase subunit 2
MKLATMQLVLGILTIVVACYFFGCMNYLFPYSILDEQERDTVFYIVIFGSLLLYPLGLVVLAIAIALRSKHSEHSTRLPVIQIICGILISAVSFLWFYKYGAITQIGNDIFNSEYEIIPYHWGWNFTTAHHVIPFVIAALFLLGLAVIITAVVRLLAVQKEQNHL